MPYLVYSPQIVSEDVNGDALRHADGGVAHRALRRCVCRTPFDSTARYAQLGRDSIQNATARIIESNSGNLSPVQQVDKTTSH